MPSERIFGRSRMAGESGLRGRIRKRITLAPQLVVTVEVLAIVLAIINPIMEGLGARLVLTLPLHP